MGNYLSQDGEDMESDDMLDEENDEVVIAFHNNNSFNDQISLERMVSSIIGARQSNHFSKTMPVIRKRPDLSVFQNTSLYREIKQLSGLSSTHKNTINSWTLQKYLNSRETGSDESFKGNQCRRVANLYIPNKKEGRLMSLESKIFVSVFNKDGSKLITASQDNVIRVFDSSKGTYHRINRISAQDISWCILDVCFSPCGQYFVYSTWSDCFFIVPLNGSDLFQYIPLNSGLARACVFSVQYSGCGKYIIGGCNDSSVKHCDLTTQHVEKYKMMTEPDLYIDINAVKFVDESTDNIFLSGCDEGTIRLWDKRCTGIRKEPVGVFIGHYDGVSFIDSRNDGRYILSNSKDQSIKIWDLRRMSSKEKQSAMRINRKYHWDYKWDYRWDNVPREFYSPPSPMDGDTSVMTYRGHRVTKSLIRARFSPLEQTGQRYIYTGCGTGRVIIYDVLTGQIKEAIESHRDIVRDVSWHPVRPEIISCSWDSHVNLNTFKRNDLKRARSEEEQPLRRSRRIALRRSINHNQ